MIQHPIASFDTFVCGDISLISVFLNGKMRPVETISGIEGKDKGE
jgi:hypothetical protein